MSISDSAAHKALLRQPFYVSVDLQGLDFDLPPATVQELNQQIEDGRRHRSPYSDGGYIVYSRTDGQD